MPESAVEVDDIRTDDGHEHYLVRPAGHCAGPAVMYLHWFDEAPNANRTQYLEEARRLAEVGVVCMLPQLTFPWHSDPTDIENDRTRIKDEVGYLLRLHEELTDVDGVDPLRTAVAGHDFGAMYGLLLVEGIAPAAGVFVAATPRWSDWFLRFWPISSDRYDYMRALGDIDPITGVTRAKCPLLFQFGRRDFYIAPMTGTELYAAAPEPKRLLDYDTGHEMDSPDIVNDRLEFLSETLGFAL